MIVWSERYESGPDLSRRVEQIESAWTRVATRHNHREKRNITTRLIMELSKSGIYAQVISLVIKLNTNINFRSDNITGYTNDIYNLIEDLKYIQIALTCQLLLSFL